MLEAAGVALPERVWAHGFVLLGGERFSKSSGVRLDLDEAIDRYGADALRYFLLREVPFDADGTFLVRALRRALQRRSRQLARQSREPRDLDGREVLRRRRAERRARRARSRRRRRSRRVSRGDGRQPRLSAARRAQARDGERRRAATSSCSRASRGRWRRIRRSARELETVLAAIVRQLARHAIHLAPFMPSKAQELWAADRRHRARSSDQRFANVASLDVTGWRVAKGASLFPKPPVT